MSHPRLSSRDRVVLGCLAAVAVTGHKVKSDPSGTGPQFLQRLGPGPQAIARAMARVAWLAQTARLACRFCTNTASAVLRANGAGWSAGVKPNPFSNLSRASAPWHGLCESPDVVRIVETLLEVQRIELGGQRLTLEQEEQSVKLRARVPAAVLERFDHWVGRGKKAVAIVRNGVCCECHLRLSSGTMAALAYTTEIHYCDNCTRILYLPEDEPLGLTKEAETIPVKPAAKKSRKRAAGGDVEPIGT